jgi:hypothetical protein
MTLLSINCAGNPDGSFPVRAYVCTNRVRTRCKDVKFDRVLEPQDVEAMRRNPEKFVSDLLKQADGFVPDTTPSEVEPVPA